MVPSIAVGTLLRQRYFIQEVLGQGGFGRTYLALDQERFNEPCVLKEFVVPYQDTELVDKAKILFQREASTLYQIQHPQIPRFWAAFEDHQRLILVQDFVGGQTYRSLLQQRKQRNQTFSESEVLHLLGYLLPVLSYIHDRNIIHRDISPENLMLWQGSTVENLYPSTNHPGLPVLIDFGSVKQVTNCLFSGLEPTRIGKVGYAPPEQLQAGKVFPHSDLYALAATSLTLLTGQEPQSLLDSQLNWQWQPYTHLSDRLASILQRMLALHPRDRYQTAHEVWTDLYPLKIVPPATPLYAEPASPLNISTVSETLGAGNLPSLSKVIERDPTIRSVAPLKAPVTRQPDITSFRKILTSWLGVSFGIMSSVLLGVVLANLSLKHFSVVMPGTGEAWVASAKLPQIEKAPLNAPQSQQSIVPNFDDGSSLKRMSQSQQIEFASGEISAVLQGNLQDYGSKSYILKASQGQIMAVNLEGTGVIMNLLRSNQQGIDAAGYQTRSWTGQLPTDDHYLIQVSGSGTYSLDVAITPLSRPPQSFTQRVAFAQGTTGTTVTGTIASNQIRRYLLKARRGQIIVAKVLQGTVNFSMIAPDGQRIGVSRTGSPNWNGRIPIDGDYAIEVSSSQTGDFALSFEIF